MIIRSKAPLRLGLAGGGSDVSPYSDIYGGAILNASINMYAYASIKPTFDGKIVINSLDKNKKLIRNRNIISKFGTLLRDIALSRLRVVPYVKRLSNSSISSIEDLLRETSIVVVEQDAIDLDVLDKLSKLGVVVIFESCRNKDIIDIIATDHAPHSVADKDTVFDESPSGIIGLETAFAVVRLPPEASIFQIADVGNCTCPL